MTGKSKPTGSNLKTSAMLAWLQGVTEVSQHTGINSFDRVLFSFLNNELLIDHFAVFTWSADEGPDHLFTRSIMPEEEAEGLARDYVETFHARDPHFKQNTNEQNMEINLTIHPSFQNEYDSQYRDHFFIQHDLVGKISVTRKVNEKLVYCNFYRIGASGIFSDEERDNYDRILPLLTNLIACHFKILQLQGKDTEDENHSTRSLVHSVISSKEAPFEKLTGRESEVCERILLGFTSIGISLDLKIAESSVNTYRRRAYEKLNIATQNELFSLCITALNRFRR